MMRSIITKLWKIVTHVQVLAVFLAFALMVFLSYYFMSGIERRHLLKNVSSAMSDAQAFIESDLREIETTLGIVTETIHDIILQGNSEDVKLITKMYITSISNYLVSDKRLSSYITGVYGVLNGTFLSGIGWIPPDDYVPESREWYKAAIEADGNIGVTPPYIHMYTNDYTVTFARQIFGIDGQPVGIVCLDVILDKVKSYVIGLSVSEGSYGILFDNDFNVLAHPINAFIGRHLLEMNDGEIIQNDLLQGKIISEQKTTDYSGKAVVGFAQGLNNGWYLGIIAYSDKYYESVMDIAKILILLALILASGLSTILLSIVSGKKRAEERIKIMLDAVPMCANFWDKNLRNIDCNQEAVKVYGFSSKKEYIERFHELSPEYQPDGRLSAEKFMEYLKKTVKDGYCYFEWMYRKFNGEMIPSEVTLVRVKYKNDYIVAGYNRDLREIKTVMAKMREADECTQVLFDATPLSCFMLDNNNNIVECNQEIVRLFGLTNKYEFIENHYKFFPEYQPNGELSREKIIKFVDEAFEEGYCRFECMHQKLDGELLPAEISLVRVKFRGEYAVAGYIRDLRELKAMIAEMRRAEIAEESSKAKSEFLAKMSHEIRTPMNAILGITEIQLQNNVLPLATLEALERIYNSGDLLLGIINDILDLSKIEAGKLELNITQYDIASLIHDTVKLNVIKYESKPIDFKLEVSENLPSLLIGDELRIKQILNNLLSNAFKYTNEGKVDLKFYTEPFKDSSNVMLVYRLSDTGQGMSADQIGRLGDKFSRFNMEANRRTEGTGLGMNITRNLIQLMNGDIQVESALGKGTTFTVRLPQGCADASPIGIELADNLMKLNIKNAVRMRSMQITREFMPYGRVLIVDDVETNLYVARGLMAPYGLSLDSTLSGIEAVEKIREGSKYDIIFMDHMMPRMDGIEATRIIRNFGYKQPIVALTANALVGQAEMFLSKGFDDFISKPIDIRHLNAVLNKYIRDKQPAEVLEAARLQKNMLYAAGNHNIAVDPQLAEFFVRDAEKAVTVLEAISVNNCRRTDDIPIFIINVHSMKSALSNIGEKDLAEEAAKLEQAGRDSDIPLILSSLSGFLKSLQELIDRLKPAEDDEEKYEEGETGDSSYLQEQLQIIQTACASLNKKLAKEALTALREKSWSKAIRENLSTMAKHLLHSEFDEVSAVAKETKFS